MPHLVAALGTAAVLASCAGFADAENLSRPAELIGRLDPPGVENRFMRPSAVYVDRTFDEVLVADSGRNRITIFAVDGTYKFEFDGRDRYSAPLDVAVDPEGFIYVLGSTRQGARVFRLDFDGTFLAEVDLEPPVADAPQNVQSIAFDGPHLVVCDRAGRRISYHDGSGRLVDAFPILDARGEIMDADVVFGALTVHDDTVWLPIASRGSVLVYSRDGALLRSVGHVGSDVGSLNFPVDVAVMSDGLVLVLDRNRFNVVCYGPDGAFRGEFGGRGISPGWYYYPSLLASDGDGRVYIGQVFRSKVEICRLPDFVRTDLKSEHLPRENNTSATTPSVDPSNAGRRVAMTASL